MASNTPLVLAAKKSGYPVEFVRNFDGTEDHSTEVVSFPCKFPEGTKLANDMTAIDQLEVIKRLQKDWSDNAVSVTIYYRLHELDAIKEWLRENYANVKSVSFLLHNDHGFDQAPLEEITKAKYEEMSKSVTPLVSIDGILFDDVSIDDCDTGACPVR
jgi:hypothetical protein